jgi:hypothetical protein
LSVLIRRKMVEEDIEMEEKRLTAAEKKKIEALDRKIERVQKKVFAKREEYDTLLGELSKLMDERHPERREENIKEALYKAYQKSKLSLEEAVQLLEDPESYSEW